MRSFDNTSKEMDSSSHTETVSFLTSEKYSSAKRYSSSELLDKQAEKLGMVKIFIFKYITN